MDLKLKEILRKKGITLKEFSSLSGISQSNLSNYLNGNISPTLETLKKMATVLNIELSELFKEKNDIELYAKFDGVFYPISKKDIVEVIERKKENESR